MNEIQQLRQLAKKVDLYVYPYDSRKGQRWFKFSHLQVEDYFSTQGIYTAMNYKDACVFLMGYTKCYDHERDQEIRENHPHFNPQIF